MIRKLALLFICSIFLGGLIYMIIPGKTIIHTRGAIIEKSLKELVSESDLIIKGKVIKKLPSKWSNPNFSRGDEISNVLQTDFQILINDVLKGTPYDLKKISIRIEGGELDKVTYIIDEMPKMEAGQDIIAFLSKDDSDVAIKEEDYYVFTGVGQGLYIKEPLAEPMYTCFYDQGTQNIVEESLFREMIREVVGDKKNKKSN